jgi:hypothetical protein
MAITGAKPGRVLILTYHFLPENLPSTLHPRYFKRYLPEFGYRADVLCSSYSTFGTYDSDQPDADPNVFRVPLGPERQRMKELHRWETFFGWHLRINDWGRPWIRHAAEAGNRMVRGGAYDAIVSCSPCFSVHRAALQIKLANPKVQWFAYLADPFVGNPFHRVNPLQHVLNQRLERKVFAAADFVVANTDAVEAMWREKYPEFAAKFFNLPNGFDFSEKAEALPIPQDRKAPVLLHAGALYGGRFPKQLLESLDRLSKAGKLSSSDLQVRLVGSIDPKSVNCPELLASMIEHQFVFLDGTVSREEALRRTGEADYLLLVDLNEKNTKFQVPSKLFDYLRIGRPILCYTPRGSETQSILAKAGVPATIVEAEAGAEEADRGLLEFLRLPNAPAQMSDWARHKFDAREMTRILVSRFASSPAAAELSRV